MSYPFFIYNGEILAAREKQERKDREDAYWAERLKDDPNYREKQLALENIWSAENVMKVIFSKRKRMIPVYKYVMDDQDIGEGFIEPKRVLIGYEEVEVNP